MIIIEELEIRCSMVGYEQKHKDYWLDYWFLVANFNKI